MEIFSRREYPFPFPYSKIAMWVVWSCSQLAQLVLIPLYTFDSLMFKGAAIPMTRRWGRRSIYSYVFISSCLEASSDSIGHNTIDYHMGFERDNEQTFITSYTIPISNFHDSQLFSFHNFFHVSFHNHNFSYLRQYAWQNEIPHYILSLPRYSAE